MSKEAKELLKSIRLADADIASRQEELETLRSLLVKSPQIKADSVQESNSGFKDDTYIKIIELSDEIDKKIDELVDKKKFVTQLIDRLENQEYMILLRLRYLNFYSWDLIAEKMFLSERQVLRLHGIALIEFSKKMSLNVT